MRRRSSRPGGRPCWRRSPKGATLALGQTKAAVNAASVDVEAALAREETGQIALMDTDDYREGVAAFLAKRPADFTGR